MRFLHLTFKLTLTAWLCYAAQPALALEAPTHIKLEDTEWGGAAPADVQAVLDSTLHAIAPLTHRQFGTVVVGHSNDAPRAVYEKGKNGEYLVQITTKGNHWAQYVYQFSHEMCHLMSNYELAPNNISRQQWFDEALCEAFGLYSLEQVAKQWENNPPYPNWKDYAKHLREYSQTNQQEPHRKLPDGMKLPAWYQQYRDTLSADPTAKDRDLNEVVSNQILPIFSEKPERWAAIHYLNLGENGKGLTLDKYFNDWETNAPPDLREPVTKIRELLLTKP